MLQHLTPETIALIADTPVLSHYQTAVALAIAYALPLPSAPVENAAVYFDSALASTTAKAVEFFNEARPVDYTSSLENVKAFWRARYAVAHGAAVEQIAVGPGLSCTALTLFGIAYNLPKALLDDVSNNAEQIQPVYARITADIARTDLIAFVASKE